MPTKNVTPKVQKLSTPKGVAADTIITKDWVGTPLILNSVEKIQTQYGLAFVAQGHPVNGKGKTAQDVSILIGASVLVKTLQAHLDNGGTFPVEVCAIKPKGLRYFVFEGDED